MRTSHPVIALALLIAIGVVACSRDDGDAAVVAPAASIPAPPAPPPMPVAPPPPPLPAELPPDATSLSMEDRDFLIARGLDHPEAELIADLRAHPELIPCRGDVGGTPGFHDPESIRILSRDRAEAGYDDGHRAGRLDLGFTVRSGKIAWKVDKTDCQR